MKKAFQPEQSLLRDLIWRNRNNSSNYRFNIIRNKKVFCAIKWFDALFPSIRDELADVHRQSFINNGVNKNDFYDDYMLHAKNSMLDELTLITADLDTSLPGIMAHIRHIKSIESTKNEQKAILRYLYSSYCHIMDKFINGDNYWRIQPQYIVESEEEAVFLRALEKQEKDILEKREQTGIKSQLTPFENPKDIEWRPNKHWLFPEETQESLKILLQSIHRMQASGELPNLDPMVLEETFSSLKYRDTVGEVDESSDDEYYQEDDDYLDELDYVPDWCEDCYNYNCQCGLDNDMNDDEYYG